MSNRANAQLREMSDWIDNNSRRLGRDPEAMLWSRVAKCANEAGEALEALSGVTGENPRKGQFGTIGDIEEELLDVAVTALGAIYHVTKEPDLFGLLEAFINERHVRAGLATTAE